MKPINEDGSESFGFPLVFKVLLWLSEVVLLGFAGLLPLLETAKPGGRFLAIGGALFFGTLALLMLPILRRLPERIHIDDRAVIYEAPGGDRVTLPWDQVARVVDRPVLQRMELHGADGFTIIRIENQLEGFDHLREIVLKRSNWERVGGVPNLPATFFRTTPYLIVVAGIAAVFVGSGLAAAFAGSLVGLWLIPLGLASLFDWLLIRVDRSGITFRNLLWRWTIPIDDIEDVRTETLRPGYGNALLAVSIRMRNGKVRRISAVRGGALYLYRALLAVVRSESFGIVTRRTVGMDPQIRGPVSGSTPPSERGTRGGTRRAAMEWRPTSPGVRPGSGSTGCRADGGVAVG